MKNSVIFLDVDGVLNQLQHWYIDDKCVVELEKVCNVIGTNRLLLTSSWRRGYSRRLEQCSPQVKRLIESLNKKGMTVVGRTKDLNDRVMEVRDYLNTHDVGKFIVLDDDLSEFTRVDTEITDRLYIVSYKAGLVSTDIKRIKKLWLRHY